MDLKGKIFKTVSYVFFLFIILIIIIQFGMPDFIGTSGQSDRFKAAEVGKEIINRRDVSQMRDQIIYTQLQGQEIPEAFRSQLTASALEQLINQKLFLVLAKNLGFYPRGKSAGRGVIAYLQASFPEYNTPNGFDFERLDAEILKPQDIGIKVLNEKASTFYFYTLLHDLAMAPKNSALDMQMLEKISYSLSVLSFDYTYLRKKVSEQVADAEIQARFVEKYLKDNPQEKLSPTIREAIVKGIVDEKLPSFEKIWREQLKKDAQEMSLAQISQKYGAKIIRLQNISAAKGLKESVSPDISNDVFVLEDEPSFLSSVFDASAKNTLKHWEIQGITFLVQVDNTVVPRFDEQKLSDTELTSLQSSLKENDFGIVNMALLKRLRTEIPVKKYSLAE